MKRRARNEAEGDEGEDCKVKTTSPRLSPTTDTDAAELAEHMPHSVVVVGLLESQQEASKNITPSKLPDLLWVFLDVHQPFCYL